MSVGSFLDWALKSFIATNAYYAQNAEYATRLEQCVKDCVDIARGKQEKDEQANPETWNNYFDGKETN